MKEDKDESCFQTVCYLKLHFKIKKRYKLEKIIQKIPNLQKKRENLFTIKNQFVFTIFPNVNHVNVMKVQHTEKWENIKKNFCNILKIPEKSINENTLTIDNMFVCFKTCYKINLCNLHTYVNSLYNRKNDIFCLSNFNPHYFPAVILRFHIRSNETFCKGGTVCIFASGNFNIMGVKTMNRVTFIKRTVLALLDTYQ